MRYEFLLILCLIYHLTPFAESPSPKVLKRLRNRGWRKRRNEEGRSLLSSPWLTRERERERMAMSRDLP